MFVYIGMTSRAGQRFVYVDRNPAVLSIIAYLKFAPRYELSRNGKAQHSSKGRGEISEKNSHHWPGRMAPLTKAQQKQVQAAEDSFNRTYAAQYGAERWEASLRRALHMPTRYALLVNRYEADSLPPMFMDLDLDDLQFIDFPRGIGTVANESEGESSKETRLISYQKTVTAETTELARSETPFPAPQVASSSNRGETSAALVAHLLTHWNLDAASLLAASVLSPQPGDKVLDLCAAPGGKSLALAQLLRPLTYDKLAPSLGGGCLHSNEVDGPRNRRLTSNLRSYLPAALFERAEIKVLRMHAAEPNAAQRLPLGLGGYDKVLLDAPCSSERHVLHAHLRARQGGKVAVNGGLASWKSGQSKKTAKLQAAILMTALRAVKVGGWVLYATCSLSRDENDGAVDKGLELAAKERKKYGTGWDVVVRSADLAGTGVERWAEKTARGWIVLPDHPGGGRWGPLFFAVLEKVAV